ncbi:MAG: putative N-carbamoyl-D-amino acid hydrolase [Deltaproteobacteria bacterium]|nr:putative N-carbamoyl-D-amino acid hydrolase [Deltaproteobacteria bacterium]
MIRIDMKAGFYQFNPVFGKKEKNLAKVANALEGINAELMVLPEFFATGYQFISTVEVSRLAEAIPGGETTDALVGLSQKHGMYIVGGLPERVGEHFYNSAVITGPEGFVGAYRKTHLFFEETLWFTPGNTGFNIFQTDLGTIGIMICFDWFFPESMRSLALQGALVIAHPANLVLPNCPAAMPIRCLENRVYAVTANRTGTEQRKDGPPLTFIGMSQIVAPDSTVIARAPAKGTSMMISDIDLKKALNKSINPYNDLFKDRRPEMYQVLGKPGDQ